MYADSRINHGEVEWVDVEDLDEENICDVDISLWMMMLDQLSQLLKTG